MRRFGISLFLSCFVGCNPATHDDPVVAQEHLGFHHEAIAVMEAYYGASIRDARDALVQSIGRLEAVPEAERRLPIRRALSLNKLRLLVVYRCAGQREEFESVADDLLSMLEPYRDFPPDFTRDQKVASLLGFMYCLEHRKPPLWMEAHLQDLQRFESAAPSDGGLGP